MIKNLVTSALFAGLAAGLVSALLQYWLVVPLVLEGELYETGVRAHFAASLDAAIESPAGPAEGLTQDLSRHAITAGFNVIAFTSFAIFLLAAMALAEKFGNVVTPRQGIIWGIAGFISLHLGPAVGLSPELPGTIAAEVSQRQLWWAYTVVATALGLGLIAFGNTVLIIALGIILLGFPHVIGAPHLDTYFGVAPPELSANFVARSLGTACASWAVLGFVTAYFWSRGQDAEQSI